MPLVDEVKCLPTFTPTSTEERFVQVKQLVQGNGIVILKQKMKSIVHANTLIGS